MFTSLVQVYTSQGSDVLTLTDPTNPFSNLVWLREGKEVVGVATYLWHAIKQGNRTECSFTHTAENNVLYYEQVNSVKTSCEIFFFGMNIRTVVDLVFLHSLVIVVFFLLLTRQSWIGSMLGRREAERKYTHTQSTQKQVSINNTRMIVSNFNATD